MNRPLRIASNLPTGATTAPHVQRYIGQVTGEASAAPDSVKRVLAGSGRLLGSALRADMEQRFGHDFSGVRVHSGTEAEQSAQDVNANAYTVGHSLVFGAGRYTPETNEGRRLIAHELTHVVQADVAASNPALPSSSVEALEHEARQVADAVCRSDAMPSVHGSARGLALPLRDPREDTDTGSFGNLPQAIPDPIGLRKRVVLVEEDGQWYEKRPGGEKWRARGSYDFIVQNGKIWAVKASSRMGVPNPGHTEAAAGGRVEYAGTVRFGSSEKARGAVQQWSNASGHYAAVRYFAKNAGLPMDKFKPVEGGFPDKGPQLPVIQPKKGEGFTPRGAGASAERLGTPQIAPTPPGTSVTGEAVTPAKPKPPPQPALIPPPPDWITAKPPVSPTAPPASVATDDPRTVAKLYSPNLIQEYRSQQLLYQFSRAALDTLEAKDAKAKEFRTELSEADKGAKLTLAAQVSAAEARMLQARKDYEMLDSPGATPQQLHEMFARRGIAIPVVPQAHTSGAAALKDSRISAWGLDDKGLTKKSGTAATQTIIGLDGMPVAFTKDTSSVTAIGLGTASKATSDKDIAVSGDKSITTDQQRTKSVDLIKGEEGFSKGTVTEIKDDAAGTSTKTIDKTTYTAGLSGFKKTKDDSTQAGSKLDSASSTVGVTREPGQFGVTAGNTTKSGTMVGPPGQEKMESGTEKSQKLTGGLVSDDKGTGIGGAASQDRRTLFGDGKSVSTTVAAGGRCQALVKEVEGSEPLKFTITTTISFDVKLGVTAGKEWEAKPGAQRDTGLKANVSASGGVAVGMYASFRRELTEAEAKKYVEFIRENGHGSTLPEHKILATGADQGWDTAKRLWQSMNGSSAMLKFMKPGEGVETNVDLGGEAKLGAGGGQIVPGGLSIGAEASAKAKHKIKVSRSVMPDGKIQVTAAIDDEGEVGGSASVGIGAANAKVGKSYTKGQGRTVVFVLNAKDLAFDSQIAAIDSAATPEDLDRLAAQYHAAEKTDKTVEGEGTTVGASVGPLSIDMGGKGKLTSEDTRDQEGKVIASKYAGENQGGGTFGIGEIKVGDSKTEAYVGEVNKEGHAKGELSATTKSTSVSKSVLKAGGKLSSDPLGTLMSPGKLIEEQTEQKGTAIADPEIMSICYAALEKSKWDWKVGGHRHDDWVATGKKIRNACTVRGTGREAEIVQVNKHAVQQALAGWNKADVEGRKEALDALLRPLGGIPSGKAFAFPDGTESIKADWDALAVADPLAGALAKLAANKPQEAQAEMLAVKNRLSALYARIKTATKKWEGIEIQHAEMLGHISARMNEVDAAVRNIAKTLPPTPKAGAAAAVTTVPTAAEAQEQEGRDRASEARADLEIYNNNIETMKGYADAVFKKLGQAEEKINDDSFFAGNKSGRIQDATPLIKDAEDLIKRWDAIYWPTFKLYEKWSPYLALDKSRIERLHTAGARGRWQQVYDLTRDKSMAGR